MENVILIPPNEDVLVEELHKNVSTSQTSEM